MVRGLLNKLVSRSLSIAGKWQQQQLRRLNINKFQGSELMGKYGVNVPKGVAISSVDEVKNAIQDVFPKENELVVKSQILAGGRGLGTFKSGLKGGVHIVKADQVEEIAGKMLGQILVTKQTGPQGKVVSKTWHTHMEPDIIYRVFDEKGNARGALDEGWGKNTEISINEHEYNGRVNPVGWSSGWALGPKVTILSGGEESTPSSK
ncbi:hypothetical protein L1049_022544 [Liquidambar formosana]|uniref:ATP-grasp fold succinyl-CoA synthetase-type domain-containing protein n=1 Tax=Liquidambar formosana TaxID=63359 RepID=A0AAP0RE02_LIQFO